jgi:LPXTG-motif cell wall-anchored protein
LDVSLLDRTVTVPLEASLDEVEAPAAARRTALAVQVEGVDGGRPFAVLRAEAASARATADEEKAEAHVEIAHARVHIPGLPLLPLIEVSDVTAQAVCAAGGRPTAGSTVLGTVRVLGKKVTLTPGGTSRVAVPGVGEVALVLARKETTARKAAATALELDVSVNPLKLNVAEVNGTVTLASAACEAPDAASSAKPPARPGRDVTPQTGGVQPAAPAPAAPESDSLAATGSTSVTVLIALGAIALLATGAGAVALARHRARD